MNEEEGPTPIDRACNAIRASQNAGWAGPCLHADYLAGEKDPDLVKEAAGSLMADLLHLARVHGVDDSELFHVARGHFYAELGYYNSADSVTHGYVR